MACCLPDIYIPTADLISSPLMFSNISASILTVPCYLKIWRENSVYYKSRFFGLCLGNERPILCLSLSVDVLFLLQLLKKSNCLEKRMLTNSLWHRLWKWGLLYCSWVFCCSIVLPHSVYYSLWFLIYLFIKNFCNQGSNY